MWRFITLVIRKWKRSVREILSEIKSQRERENIQKHELETKWFFNFHEKKRENINMVTFFSIITVIDSTGQKNKFY